MKIPQNFNSNVYIFLSRNFQKRLFQIVILSLFVTSLPTKSSFGTENTPNQEKNVLLIFSQVPNTPAYTYILEGIRQKLDESFGDNYNLYIEYLEAERLPNSDYPKERFDSYNHKYQDIKLDLLINVGYGSPKIIRQLASNQLLNPFCS